MVVFWSHQSLVGTHFLQRICNISWFSSFQQCEISWVNNLPDIPTVLSSVHIFKCRSCNYRVAMLWRKTWMLVAYTFCITGIVWDQCLFTMLTMQSYAESWNIVLDQSECCVQVLNKCMYPENRWPFQWSMICALCIIFVPVFGLVNRWLYGISNQQQENWYSNNLPVGVGIVIPVKCYFDMWWVCHSGQCYFKPCWY